ncbi:MAG: pilus assembly protein TadG-related protein [Candidatus Krumholzibacteria bacterium]|nr:pilus assembly protein TadG-related protein [Candidatus Krumholzibacteria bacterium]
MQAFKNLSKKNQSRKPRWRLATGDRGSGLVNTCKSLLGNRCGSAMIMVAVSIVAVFAFAVLAIDASMLMTTRTQLQAAADAAALAGASGLLGGSQAEAINRAIDYASYNQAVQETMSPVVITASDISFPEPDVIRVRTHRTAATGDALRTYFLRVINPLMSTADMTAVAAARVYDVCSSQCLRPWSIPDRWDDADTNGVYDAGEFYDPVTTGYVAPADVGTPIVLKVGNPQQAISSGVFFPVNFPPLDNDQGISPLTGGSWYETWITECEPYPVEPGDRLQIEPGNMVGPTMHGMEELLALDPYAEWDPATKSITNSAYGLSPRIGLVPFFDPTQPPESGRNWVTVTKVGAFFIESVGPGSQVNARFIQVTSPGLACTGGLGSSLVKGIVLVE